MFKKCLLACAVVMCTLSAFAQTPVDDALSKTKEAIKLEDAGKTDEAITLLEEAVKLAPDNFTCTYELAYGYSIKPDYPKAIEVCERLVKFKDVTGQAYQLLGNCYDEMGDRDKAIGAYDAGLKKFATAGYLYLEKGIVLMRMKDYNKALAVFETGIKVAPKHASNYFWAAKIYLGSDEKVWGMLYGEIFMNLERGTKRTAEMSKLLYDTYKSQITFTSDTSLGVSFSKNSVINVNSLKDAGKFKMPFGVGVYEPAMLVAVSLNTKQITLDALDTVRTAFLDFYFKKFIKDYPIVLFYYQNEIQTAGHFEAYNHWLLMKGDEAAFTAWQTANKQKWDDFIKWYTNNPIQLDDSNKFNTGQYN